MPEVSLNRSTAQLLGDAGEHTHWQLVLELNGGVGAAVRFAVRAVHGCLGATRAVRGAYPLGTPRTGTQETVR
jgi:hypothetical protein